MHVNASHRIEAPRGILARARAYKKSTDQCKERRMRKEGRESTLKGKIGLVKGCVNLIILIPLIVFPSHTKLQSLETPNLQHFIYAHEGREGGRNGESTSGW